MNIKEYTEVKEMNYKQYCDYLKSKYGVIKKAYFRPSFSKDTTITRTKDGLVIHHIREDTVPMLSTKEFAKIQPYEWQLGENLVYCNYLEHLLLHILITEESPIDSPIGIGGVQNFIAIELNDVYSGFSPNQDWRKTLHQTIINDKKVYFELIKRFKTNCCEKDYYNEYDLYRSYNAQYELWDDELNLKIYRQLKEL